MVKDCICIYIDISSAITDLVCGRVVVGSGGIIPSVHAVVSYHHW